MATAYAKDAAAGRRRGIVWGATPWGKDSFELEAVLEDGRLLAAYLNESVGRTVAGGAAAGRRYAQQAGNHHRCGSDLIRGQYQPLRAEPIGRPSSLSSGDRREGKRPVRLPLRFARERMAEALARSFGDQARSGRLRGSYILSEGRSLCVRAKNSSK